MLRLIALCPLSLAILLAQTPPLLENDQVRVIQAVDQPHARSAPHQHPLNRVMVYLSAGEQEIIPAGGPKTTLRFAPGDVKWSPASGTHTSQVVSNAAVKIIEIEVKKPGDPAQAGGAFDPLKFTPAAERVEFQNPQVRVIRIHIPPHAHVPLHEHLLHRVVVYLTAQHTRFTAADGTISETRHDAGQVSWGLPVRHAEENLLAAPVDEIVVEIRN